MSGKRQPTAVVKAAGRKHLSKAEEYARLECEVHVDQPESVEPPKWLKLKKQREEFVKIGQILLDNGLYTELDKDCLAMYFVCRDRWLDADKEAKAAISEGNSKQAQAWSSVQGTYFKQAQRCATELGLTISSRCRLVVPASMGGDAENDSEDEFSRALEERKRAAGGM